MNSFELRSFISNALMFDILVFAYSFLLSSSFFFYYSGNFSNLLVVCLFISAILISYLYPLTSLSIIYIDRLDGFLTVSLYKLMCFIFGSFTDFLEEINLDSFLLVFLLYDLNISFFYDFYEITSSRSISSLLTR